MTKITSFIVRQCGGSADEAFYNAKAYAMIDNDSYIAAKEAFIITKAEPGRLSVELDKMESNPHYDWARGPARCIDMGDGEYIFFGWAEEE